MIEYAHEEKFFQHTSVNLLIVDSGATVTAVSGDAPQVTCATIQITNEMLLKESFSLKESLCSEENLKFGTMEASYCNFTFIGADVPSLKEEEIIIYLYFDGDSSTLFPIGRYIVESDEWTSTSGTLSPRQVDAYDLLAMLEDYDITEWYNEAFSENTTVSVKDLRDSLFEWLAEEEPDYHIEQAETTLINDDFMIEKSIESDVITFGFFMRGLMEINGVFGHIDRNGNFNYVQLDTYDMPAKSIILNDKRIPPTDYADITVWGIGYVAVYDQDNIRIAKEGSSSQKHPNVYTVVDNFAFSNLNSTAARLENIKAAVQNMRDAIYHRRYRPYKMQTAGNLCIEVGDRIDIQYSLDDENTPKTYYTYVLQRSFKGIQSFRDTFEAKGERKQPKYKLNDNWHIGDSQDSSADGTGGVGNVNDTAATKFIKYCRNIGIRLLQEPSVNLEYVRSGGTHQVEITWSDPSDITNYKPVPCAWAGTIVVRSESKPPVHPWDDCEILVTSTTRDEYSETPFVDNTIEENKKYYYGIFPYHIALDDADHPIKYYRFTKVISVNTQRLIMAPLIVSHTVSGSDVTLTIEIPVLEDGSYSYVKAVAKKGSIPASKTDGTVIDLSAMATSVTFSGLDEQSHYYFVIFANDGGASDIASDPDDCTTGRNEGYNFAYTGSIQTFTAPKTGIYQLETWGAQGGNASDDSLVARGGYGAYAKGEVLLTQGETIYINVGGQNGYGGGGNALIRRNLTPKTYDTSHYVTGGDGYGSTFPSAFSEYKNSDYILWTNIHQGYSNIPLLINSEDNVISTVQTSSVDEGYLGVPFEDITNVKKVIFDIMFTAHTNIQNYNLWCLQKDLDYSKSFRMYLESASTEIGVWQTVEVEVPAEKSSEIFNYLRISLIPVSNTTISIRNIKFICDG